MRCSAVAKFVECKLKDYTEFLTICERVLLKQLRANSGYNDGIAEQIQQIIDTATQRALDDYDDCVRGYSTTTSTTESGFTVQLVTSLLGKKTSTASSSKTRFKTSINVAFSATASQECSDSEISTIPPEGAYKATAYYSVRTDNLSFANIPIEDDDINPYQPDHIYYMPDYYLYRFDQHYLQYSLTKEKFFYISTVVEPLVNKIFIQEFYPLSVQTKISDIILYFNAALEIIGPGNSYYDKQNIDLNVHEQSVKIINRNFDARINLELADSNYFNFTSMGTAIDNYLHDFCDAYPLPVQNYNKEQLQAFEQPLIGNWRFKLCLWYYELFLKTSISYNSKKLLEFSLRDVPLFLIEGVCNAGSFITDVQVKSSYGDYNYGVEVVDCEYRQYGADRPVVALQIYNKDTNTYTLTALPFTIKLYNPHDITAKIACRTFYKQAATAIVAPHSSSEEITIEYAGVSLDPSFGDCYIVNNSYNGDESLLGNILKYKNVDLHICNNNTKIMDKIKNYVFLETIDIVNACYNQQNVIKILLRNNTFYTNPELMTDNTRQELMYNTWMVILITGFATNKFIKIIHKGLNVWASCELAGEYQGNRFVIDGEFYNPLAELTVKQYKTNGHTNSVELLDIADYAGTVETLNRTAEIKNANIREVVNVSQLKYLQDYSYINCYEGIDSIETIYNDYGDPTRFKVVFKIKVYNPYANGTMQLSTVTFHIKTALDVYIDYGIITNLPPVNPFEYSDTKLMTILLGSSIDIETIYLQCVDIGYPGHYIYPEQIDMNKYYLA